jgi:hypothetical protein
MYIYIHTYIYIYIYIYIIHTCFLVDVYVHVMYKCMHFIAEYAHICIFMQDLRIIYRIVLHAQCPRLFVQEFIALFCSIRIEM